MGAERRRDVFTRQGDGAGVLGARVLATALVLFALLALAPAPALARTIRVGYYKFAGYQEVSADGTRSGYGYEFLQEVARYAGWDYEYVGYDLGWADLQKMLDDGQIDILTSARKTPAREGTYLFSTEMGTSAGILTVRSGSTRVTVGDYATYDGLRVGMIRDSSINASFEAFAQEKGFSFTPVYFGNVDDLNQALQSGDGIDAVCTTNLRRPQNEWVLDEFDSENFYAMMNAKDTGLQSEVDAAIAQMDLYSPGWRTTLWNKYYTPDTGDQISLTADERSYLAGEKSRTYTVLVNPDDAPYSSIENGKASGIIPAVFDEVAKRAGISFEFVSVPDRASYAEKVKDGGVDIVADAIFDYDKAEKSGRKLTLPYLDTPISWVGRKDMSGSSLTVAEPSSGDATYGSQIAIQSDATILPCASVEECLQAVDSGRADVTYAFPYSVQRWQEEGNGLGLSVVMLPKASVSFALGVSDDEDPRLLTILNKAVSSVKESYVEQAVTTEITSSGTRLSLVGFLKMNPIWIVVSMALLAGLAALLGVIFSRQRSLRLIQEKNEQLKDAVQKATEANEAKSDFLSSMSHDMRTPLNGIIGFTNFALEEKDGARRQEDLEKIRQSSSILLGLVNDTLELSRIESGKFVLEPEWFKATDLIGGIVAVIEEEARRRGISFRTSIECADDLAIRSDRLKLQELLLNLLSNAVKYTEPGGWVRLAFGCPTSDGAGGCRIVVADNGIGISEEFLPHVFDSFAQERNVSRGAEGGSGLGLAIVKRIVDLMGGSIDVESRKGVGTTFTVSLPLETREAAPGEADAAGGTKAAEATGIAGIRILLAEDNELNTEIARRLLEDEGARVACVGDGRQAVEAFEASRPGSVDVILMDVHMPVMDGLEATARIRGLDRPDARTTPIVAMTADAYAEDIRKCLESGMDAHVAKPIDPQALFGAIRECVGTGRGGD
jgi:signal transduction histidine kinase/ActR/RegA family two-component response regulator